MGSIDFKLLQKELHLPAFEGDVNTLIDTFCLEVGGVLVLICS
jgi:hypothetical protein